MNTVYTSGKKLEQSLEELQATVDRIKKSHADILASMTPRERLAYEWRIIPAWIRAGMIVNALLFAATVLLAVTL
jgi:hypothetical protein